MTTPLVTAERPSDEALLKTFSHAGDSVVGEVQGLATLAARTFGASMGLVGYLEGERLWYPVTVGLGSLGDDSLGRTLAECVARERDVFVIENLREDPRFAGSALVTGPDGARFLAGAPLTAASGRKIGILAVLDRQPRAASIEETDGLRVLARQVLAQLELAHAREMLECIFRQSGEGIVVVDENGAPQILNAEARRQRGGTEEDALARDAWLLEGGDGRIPVEETLLYRAAHGERIENEQWEVSGATGDTRWLSGSALPLRHPNGAPAGAILLTRDETERVRMQEALQNEGRFRDQLLAIVGHDLRTPLSGVLMGARYLQAHRALSPPDRSAVDRIIRQAERMNRMVHDLLDYSRLRVGQRLNVVYARCDSRRSRRTWSRRSASRTRPGRCASSCRATRAASGTRTGSRRSCRTCSGTRSRTATPTRRSRCASSRARRRCWSPCTTRAPRSRRTPSATCSSRSGAAARASTSGRRVGSASGSSSCRRSSAHTAGRSASGRRGARAPPSAWPFLASRRADPSVESGRRPPHLGIPGRGGTVAERPTGTASAWAPPASFEEYEIIRALGGGTAGRVYLAHDTLLDRAVAIKFLLAPLDAAVLARFLGEARAAARIQHPNVATLYRVGQLAQRPYLVSEYVRGRSLEQHPRPVPWDEAQRLALGLRGASPPSTAPALHRDVSPKNVVVSDTGEVKLVDFGLAQIGDPSEAEAGPGGPRELVGTPRYAAPELWRGEPASRRADVHAFGALVYELCVGRPPHGDVAAWIARRPSRRATSGRCARSSPG